MKRTGQLIVTLLVISICAVYVYAGDLEPPAGDPAPTMHTLEEIYYMLEGIDTRVNPYQAFVGKSGAGNISGYTLVTGEDGDLQKGVQTQGPRFLDNGDGTVTDNLTGLIWLQDISDPCFSDKPWAGAITSCNDLTSGTCGLTDGSQAGDWRLPNVKELLSLVDYSQTSPALPIGHPFVGIDPGQFWSSTTRATWTAGAYTVDSTYGNVAVFNKADASPDRPYWPVRGGND